VSKHLKLGIAGICVMAIAVILAILDEHKVMHLSIAGAMAVIGILFVGFIMAFRGFRKWAAGPSCDKCRR